MRNKENKAFEALNEGSTLAGEYLMANNGRMNATEFASFLFTSPTSEEFH